MLEQVTAVMITGAVLIDNYDNSSDHCLTDCSEICCDHCNSDGSDTNSDIEMIP